MDISKNFPLLLFINVPNWHFECHEVQGTVLAARERGWIKHHSYSQRTRPVISPLSEQRTAIQPKIITEVWPKHCENSAEDNWIHRSLSNFTLRLLPPQDRKYLTIITFLVISFHHLTLSLPSNDWEL